MGKPDATDGTFEYYSPSGTLLGAWGRGPLKGLRGILDSDYTDVLAFQEKVRQRTVEVEETGPDGAPADPGWSKPVIGPIGQAMFETSKPIEVQANQSIVLEALFQKAKREHGVENGVFLVYSFKDAKLSLEPAQNMAPADKRKTQFWWDMGIDPGNLPVMKHDRTKVIVGTLHTHWDDAGREAPKLSDDKDIPSAKEKEFVVYALDRGHLHRAGPDGKADNGLPRNLTDVLSPALRIFGAYRSAKASSRP